LRFLLGLQRDLLVVLGARKKAEKQHERKPHVYHNKLSRRAGEWVNHLRSCAQAVVARKGRNQEGNKKG
jgi:hypothetical protein